MARLAVNVLASDPIGNVILLEAGTEPPDWAPKFGDHCYEADTDSPPARAGRGSGKDAWAAYAAARDVQVDPDASRDEIIAALDDAGVPTE